ncbi:hypothetical protein FRC09_005047 [Ceratobasidium sp. 395]|nr:hypothetical protein FRC09_005047 [Ceratobasidium sp. 395]
MADTFHINDSGAPTVLTEAFRKLLQSKGTSKVMSLSEMPKIPQEILDELEKDVDEAEGIYKPSPIIPVIDPAQTHPLPSEPPEPRGARGRVYKRTLDRIQTSHPDQVADFLAFGMDILGQKMRQNSESTNNAQDLLVAYWIIFLEHHLPNLSKDRYWNIETLMKYTELFYINLVQTVRGRSNLLVAGPTLKRWNRIFVACIGMYAKDDKGVKVGTFHLAKGFYKQLAARVKWITREFELERFPSFKGYVGQLDIASIFQHGFNQTEEGPGREGLLETHLAVTAGFYTGMRTGSLVAGSTRRREDGMYTTLGDLRIKVPKPGLFDVELVMKYRKGYNDTADPGRPDTFRLQHVTKTHNLAFDFGTILLALLFCRGVLEGIETVEDLFSWDKSEIKIKKDHLKEPLFRKKTSRGDPDPTNEPALSNSILGPFMRIGRALGMGNGINFHSVRRDAANLFGLVFGNDVARRLLSHAEGNTTFDRHYSKGVYNYPIVPARLGELDQTASPINQMAIGDHRKECMVVNAILSPKIERLPDENIQSAQAEAIKSDLIHQVYSDTLDSSWDKFFNYLPKQYSINYERDLRSFTHIMRAAKKLPLWEEHGEELLKASYLILLEQIREQQGFVQEVEKNLKKKTKRKLEAETRAKFPDLSAEHTTEERDAVREELEQAGEFWKQPTNKPGNLAEKYTATFFGVVFNQKMFDNPKLQGGIWAPDFAQSLQQPNLFEFLSKHDKELAEDEEGLEEGFRVSDTVHQLKPTDQKSQDQPAQPTTKGDDFFEEGQRARSFDDRKEKNVFSSDRVISGHYFFWRLVRPVVEQREQERRFKADGNVYKCYPCAALKHAKSASYQETYLSPSLLKRHQEAAHDLWRDLPVCMLTDSEDKFVCPSEKCQYQEPCDFSAETVDEVYEHCLEQCPNLEKFNEIFDLCPREPSDFDKMGKTREKKHIRMLFDGITLHRGTPGWLDRFDELTDKEILACAERESVRFPHLEEYLPNLRKILSLGKTSIVDGKVVNKHASKSLAELAKELLTEEVKLYIDEHRRGTNEDDLPNTLPDLEAMLLQDEAPEEE